MSLNISHNMMPMNASRDLNTAFTPPSLPAKTTSGDQTSTNTDPGLQQMARDEIKLPDNASPQAAAETQKAGTIFGAQDAPPTTAEIMAAPRALEQMTGSLVNVSDMNIGNLIGGNQPGRATINTEAINSNFNAMMNSAQQGNAAGNQAFTTVSSQGATSSAITVEDIQRALGAAQNPTGMPTLLKVNG
ncbi:MAG: hypothetical protein RDU24_10700 [Humidesulfovibrio sp.]|uniref:hypothetical protein n=1 Tax=Humidesulfovibrio sp. TaxID=2910988 RepID=UPI0027F0B17D|nr:hypothetical protein [Humidesulfovibrio sp.]MDQ7835838.1 hypothetical protein [Humidesulfovibrio sp.]